MGHIQGRKGLYYLDTRINNNVQQLKQVEPTVMGHGHKSYGNAFGHQFVALAIDLPTERSLDNAAARTVTYKNDMTIPGSCRMALSDQDII